jgi:hypothetical protein
VFGEFGEEAGHGVSEFKRLEKTEGLLEETQDCKTQDAREEEEQAGIGRQ